MVKYISRQIYSSGLFFVFYFQFIHDTLFDFGKEVKRSKLMSEHLLNYFFEDSIMKISFSLAPV